MRILQVIPGTGNFYCGSCIRDTGMVRAFRQRGHDVVLQPLYLPLYTDEPGVEPEGEIFFGGINVYLQQKLDWFQKTPRWLDSFFDSRWLLQMSSKKAGMTKASELGDMTVSMLKGIDGRQHKELNRLIQHLKEQPAFDVIVFSNALLLGMAVAVKEALKVPVVCTLQGEDGFLDALLEPYKTEAWSLFAQHASRMDRLVPVSHYYSNLLKERLAIEHEKFSVVPNGISLEGYGELDDIPKEPTLGYLARLCETKGLNTLVDAFIQLKQQADFSTLKLKIAGTMTGADQPFVESMKKQLEKHSLLQDVEITPNISREEKIKFLKSLTAFSVPATYGESFGIYVLEALAAGAPVIQPRHAGFVEILETTQGGRFYEPGDMNSYVSTLASVLSNPEESRRMAETGRQKVLEYYTLDRMTDDVLQVFQQVQPLSASNPS